LIVGWNLTYRCNLSCAYCGVGNRECAELDSSRIIEYIGQLHRAGTRFVNFSGGEPLLRDDLGELIRTARGYNIRTGVTSNGTLVADAIDQVKEVNEIQLSLDGPPAVHDRIRGKDVYDKVIESIEACKKRDIPVSISAVISKLNADDLSPLLLLAEHYRMGIYFQPIDISLSLQCKGAKALMPTRESYRRAIDFLRREKRRGSLRINNSISGLNHLANWPSDQAIPCLVGNSFCNIEPNGNIGVCDRFAYYERDQVPAGNDIAEAYARTAAPRSCEQCWSGSTVEYNLLKKFRPDPWKSMWDRINKCTCIFIMNGGAGE